MLGKLLKHDFLSTAKVMIPLNLVLLISTFFGCIFLGTKLWHREEFFFLFILLFFAYVIMISSVLYITLIYLTVHYYRNMFSSQGYLTFTLPVSSWTLLNSRFLTGFFWYLITGFFTVFSVTALVISVLGFSNVFSFLKDIIVTKTIDIDGFIYEISDVTQQMFGYTIPQLIFLILLLVLISSFASVAIGYGSVTIGQLYAKHKIAGSILSYIGIYFLSQLLTTGLTFVVGFSNTFTLMINNDPSKIDSLAFYRALYGPMIPLLLITFTIFGVTCYIISGIILKKRINLD